MSIQASSALCAFVHKVAPPHYATPDAPASWDALRKWYRTNKSSWLGIVYPVYDGGCESTIYPDAPTNHAFRAWHDYIHCTHGYGFTRGDEIKVGIIHMQQARKAGLPQSDLDMLIADTIGQVEYYYQHKAYVGNQAEFVGDVLTHGLRTVLDTGRRY